MSTYHLINFNVMTAVEICRYLKDRHSHPVMQSMAQVSGDLDAWLKEFAAQGGDAEKLRELILETFRETEDHLRKKEKIFYPFVEVVADWEKEGRSKFHLVKIPIAKMIEEQKNIVRKVSEIRQSTSSIDSTACTNKTCIMCMTALFEIEQELNRQFHIEQTILFPKLLELEKNA